MNNVLTQQTVTFKLCYPKKVRIQGIASGERTTFRVDNNENKFPTHRH